MKVWVISTFMLRFLTPINRSETLFYSTIAEIIPVVSIMLKTADASNVKF